MSSRMISRYQVTAEESTERSLPENGAGQRSLAYERVNMIMIKKSVVKGRCLGWAEEQNPKQENPAEILSPATSGIQDLGRQQGRCPEILRLNCTAVLPQNDTFSC